MARQINQKIGMLVMMHLTISEVEKMIETRNIRTILMRMDLIINEAEMLIKKIQELLMYFSKFIKHKVLGILVLEKKKRRVSLYY
jgi:hypothetical protein